MRWVRSYTGSQEETLAIAGWGEPGAQKAELPAELDLAAMAAELPAGARLQVAGNPDAELAPPKGIILDPQHFEPVFISDYNYYPLFASLEDDVTLIEWDMALSREDRKQWAKHCDDAPGLVQAAPYRQYYGWCKPDGADWGYVHRNLNGPIAEGDPDCDLVGFGLVYLPLWIIRAAVTECSDPDIFRKRTPATASWLESRYLTDVTFSHWHREALGHRVPIRWDVRPVHLHYPAG